MCLSAKPLRLIAAERSATLDLTAWQLTHLDSCEPRDLVAQSVEEQGQAGGQLGIQRVTQRGDDQPHAGDGALLHLLAGGQGGGG